MPPTIPPTGTSATAETAETAATATTGRTSARRHPSPVPVPRPRRTAIARWGAVAWSGATAAAGLWWALGGAGFPFGEGDPDAAVSVLGGLNRATGAPAVALLGAATTVLAITMAQERGKGRGAARSATLAAAWTLAAGLALVVPDARLLMLVGYAPALILGAPFGWPPGVDVWAQLAWPLPVQPLVVLGGVVWAAAAVRYARVTSPDSTGPAGADGRARRRNDPAVLRRWGRWAVAVASVVPVGYALTRWAWLAGLPVGLDAETLAAGGPDQWLGGAALGAFAAVGAVLQLGLVGRWGEVVPGWVPGLGDRRVPPAVAVVPATVVALLLTAGGLMFVRLTLTGAVAVPVEGLGAALPVLLLPVWGAALGVATWAYRQRRALEAQGPTGTNPDS